MYMRAFTGLADLLMPPVCTGCKQPLQSARGYCADCWSALRPVADPVCETCGDPMPTGYRTESICLSCHKTPPPFDAARAPYVYTGTARETVLKFKYGREQLARLMAPAMLRAARPLLMEDTFLVPVPLHRWRLAARGYNQAGLLARELAKAGAGRLLPDALRRVKATSKTIGAGREARFRMMAGAFAVPDSARPRLQGAHVLLVDDVLTTGATVSAAARTLRRAGVARVDVITYARVAPDDSSTYLIA